MVRAGKTELTELIAAVGGGLWTLRLLSRFWLSRLINLGSPPLWSCHSESLSAAAKGGRVGVQNDMGPSSPPPQMHLQRGYLKQGHVESRSKNVTTRSHLPLLWKHFLGPDMSGIPKVIRGLTKRNLVRVNYTEACFYYYGPNKGHGSPASLMPPPSRCAVGNTMGASVRGH